MFLDDVAYIPVSNIPTTTLLEITNLLQHTQNHPKPNSSREMGRWSYLDTDDERLPHGMRRVGYDADTQTYTYADASGTMYEGVPGARYGHMRRANTEPRRTGERTHGFIADDDDFHDSSDDKFRARLKRYKNRTFQDILGPAMTEEEKEGDGGGRLRRWLSISKAAKGVVAKQAAERTSGSSSAAVGKGSGAGGGFEKVKDEDEEEGDLDELDEKPLPPLPPQPVRRPRRANTVVSIARGVGQGVKQMFAEESEFKARRS